MPIAPLRRCSVVDAADRLVSRDPLPRSTSAKAQQPLAARCSGVVAETIQHRKGLGGHGQQGINHGVALSPPSPSALNLILADTSARPAPLPTTLMAKGSDVAIGTGSV